MLEASGRAVRAILDPAVAAYRQEMCSFCQAGSIERCPRCQVAVCAAHGLGGTPHCAMCRKELEDDLDVAGFTVAVHEAPPDSSPLVFSRGPSLWELLKPLFGGIDLYFRRRRVERAFARRTLAEIAAWRREAGVRTRG